MKVKEILVQNEDGSVEVKAEFSADELQHLLQFAVNMSASIGLSSHNKWQMARKDAAEQADELFEKAKRPLQ